MGQSVPVSFKLLSCCFLEEPLLPLSPLQLQSQCCRDRGAGMLRPDPWGNSSEDTGVQPVCPNPSLPALCSMSAVGILKNHTMHIKLRHFYFLLHSAFSIELRLEYGKKRGSRTQSASAGGVWPLPLLWPSRARAAANILGGS